MTVVSGLVCHFPMLVRSHVASSRTPHEISAHRAGLLMAMAMGHTCAPCDNMASEHCLVSLWCVQSVMYCANYSFLKLFLSRALRMCATLECRRTGHAVGVALVLSDAQFQPQVGHHSYQSFCRCSVPCSPALVCLCLLDALLPPLVRPC